MSEYMKYFPSMIKFGVPSAQATWAISVGIPLRQTAITVAEAFIKENDVPSHSSFLKWIRAVGRTRWVEDFQLSSSSLEDVTRAVSLASRNPLLVHGVQALPITVSRHLAQTIAPEMDAGEQFKAVAKRVAQGEEQTRVVTVSR